MPHPSSIRKMLDDQITCPHLHGMGLSGIPLHHDAFIIFYLDLPCSGRCREWDVLPTLTNQPSMSTPASLPNTVMQREHPQCTEAEEFRQPTWTRTWQRRNSSSGCRMRSNQASLKPATYPPTALLPKLAAPRVAARPVARKRGKERSNGEFFEQYRKTKNWEFL